MVPALTPVTIPLVLPTVATAVLLLIQVPPVGVPVRFDVPPTQVVNAPVNDTAGAALLIVTEAVPVAEQVLLFVTVTFKVTDPLAPAV